MDILVMKINKIDDLKTKIKEFSRSLGFYKVGFAKAKSVGTEIDNYITWLSNGYHASMSYLETNLDKRKNVELILPGVRTVVVFAHSYYTNATYTNDLFKVSRYAWGTDYHDVLKEKIKKVAEFIKEYVHDFEYKIYVDTGPILEKFWFVEAGLGWQGKNSLVLSKDLGSYFFIGILLLSIEIEPDLKIKEHCGSCTMCIQACPTGAIVHPKVLDSRKCISFWTIEKKKNENIPENLDLNGWIFGCDICQEVCPWNKKAKLTSEKSFYPLRFGTNLDKKFLENMSFDNFLSFTKNSPLRRAKFEGLIKNFKHILQYNETK